MANYPFLWTGQPDASNVTNGAYCRAEDVQSLFKNIAAYSTLDVAEFQRRAGDAAVEIDRMIEANYLVPVTNDPAALSILRIINDRLAAAIVGEVYFRKDNQNVPPQVAQWRTWSELMLKDILDGVIRFYTAPTRANGDLPMFPPGAGATFNPADDADANFVAKPLFQRGGRGNKSSLGDLI